MAKTIQMLKMNVFGARYTVAFTENTNRNPFCLYEHTTTFHDEYPFKREHKRVLAKYANFESCLYHLLQSNEPEFRRDSNFPA